MSDKFEGFCALLFGAMIGFFLGGFIGGFDTCLTVFFSAIGMFTSFGVREHYLNKIDEMKWAVRSSKNIIL